MNDEIIHQKNINKILNELRDKRDQIFYLSPGKKMSAILDAPHPAAIVHSYPEEDFYFLIHDIGLSDSLELFALASNKQWEYVLDMETWAKDRVDVKSTTLWLDLLFTADPDRFIKWFINEKKEFVEFYLYKNLDIKIRENEQDILDLGDDYFTINDVFYVKIIDAPLDVHADIEVDDTSLISMDKIRKTFLMKFLSRLAGNDHVLYQQVLLESLSLIPAEIEEEAYRLKNFRLAEKGYLPFDEALGIYKPLNPKDLSGNSIKHILISKDKKSSFSSPLYPIKMLNKDNLFTDSLKTIDSDDILQQLQTEFAGLSNKIIAADRKQITCRNDLKNIVEKGCGYISIGLEYLTDQYAGERKKRTKAFIQTYPLEHIFRIGYGYVLKLKWTADKWMEKNWFAKNGFSLSFWGEERFGLLGGLLLKKPLYYDNYETGVLYREFSSSDDIKHTEKILNEVMEIDYFLSLMNIKPYQYKGFVTFENMMLTLWARHFLSLRQTTEAKVSLTLDEFRQFFENLWEDESFNKKSPVKISAGMKDAFLKWMSFKTGKDTSFISTKLGQTMENLFIKIESELGSVLTQHLDPKYIHLFIIEV